DLKIRVGHDETRRMAEKIVARPVIDGPGNAETDGLEERLLRPVAGPKRTDVANRAHRHFNQARRINEGLCVLLCRDDALQDGTVGALALGAERVGRVEAADPGKSLFEQHLLDVDAVVKTVLEAARRTEAGWEDAQALPHCGRGKPDVVGD